jgi:hypothetical protein
MMNKTWFLNLLLTLLLTSCEKAIDLNLDEIDKKLVVEATIDNGGAPVVMLSNSLDFFSEITPVLLNGSFVHDADVFISDGNTTHRLKEYSKPVSNGFSVSYYTTDSSNLSTAITGQLNKTYSLRIVADGKEYASTTSIPNITRRIDSMWWKNVYENPDSTKVTVMIKATDAPGYGNYIRYFTKRNHDPFYPGLNSVFDDQIIDGTTYEIEVERGIDRNIALNDTYSFFNKGDTVTLKLCEIDKATFDFWRTMEFSYASIGNPFSSPTKVSGNISNGALGYFGGYACQYHTIIIPR